MQTTTTANGKSVYEVGLNELHVVSSDEAAHKRVDNEFREARGREGARLHVTLKAISEVDARATENTRATLESIAALTSDLQQRASNLAHLIQSFEASNQKYLENFSHMETEHFNTIKSNVAEFRQAATSQLDATYTHLSTQGRESTERLAVDVRKLRDEVISLIDSRMNQADASFAALRGDTEVVKFLVMDLIKDRIGRTDPKQKPF